MDTSKTFLESCDHHRIPIYQWPLENPRGAILVLHGMAEHGLRYARLAQALNAAGYTVMAINHRGHGEDTPEVGLGTFAPENGWNKVLDDVDRAWSYMRKSVRKHTHQNSPDTPLFVLGHSMGSFITQAWLMKQPENVAGAVLSGSNFTPATLLKLGRLVTLMESYRIGTSSCSKLVDTLTFGSYNNAFKPVRTSFDWLSRDAAEVDTYIADPLCGFQCTNGLWLDLFQGLLSISSVSALKNIDSQLPLYIVGGDKDPVGQAGKGLRKLAGALVAAGLQDITTDIYPNGRHEMFNETNRDEVTTRLTAWLDNISLNIPDHRMHARRPKATL
ncbi:alpha/beta fold hydrolase [Sansalvadorimonas verongulae]|uniref:alpha/beta fold hydrolase n=1 Tax=Sansalvadorimonas verongulae TaxID=2172824 RepID=UPI0012BBB93F|nr:alpha/beta fold hydrolase [Sansalvadorimonas verongulae]MTI12591.1 alpha/beta fold hydrolase [Sansalvadorimonas verongulae]